MKKLIALLLAVSVLFSLALTGCKSETPDDIGDNETAASGKDPDRLIKIGFVFSAIVSTDAWSQTSENARAVFGRKLSERRDLQGRKHCGRRGL